uniref:Uncharacterized protein n=1 Tax=Arundo donax TaxID=35708 RepID=A0A0A8YWL0_ARUDO
MTDQMAHKDHEENPHLK